LSDREGEEKDEESAEEEQEGSDPDGPPSLEPAPSTEEERRRRPSWYEVPRTIKKTLAEGDRDAPLFGFHLRGGAVSEQGVRIGFLTQFLDEFRKLFAPLQVVPTGEIPEGNRLPKVNAGELGVAGLAAEASVVIHFSLPPEEVEIFDSHPSRERAFRLLSVQAVGHLGALLKLDPKEVDIREAVEPFGRRIGRSYGQMAHLLGEAGVEADWWSDLYSADEIEVLPPRSREIADELLRKPIAETEEMTVGGFLWEATTASDRRSVRLQFDRRSVKATYDIPLTTRVTEALSRIVRVRLRETAFRYPFAERAHRREWELLEILEVGGPAGALADAELEEPV
jgi:hypothetical protein